MPSRSGNGNAAKTEFSVFLYKRERKDAVRNESVTGKVSENQMAELMYGDHKKDGAECGNQNPEGVFRHIIKQKIEKDKIDGEKDIGENFFRFLIHEQNSFR